MLGSAVSDDNLPDNFSNRIFNVFHQDDITKIYQDYISIFDEYITYTYNNFEGVEIAKAELSETLQHSKYLLEKVEISNYLNKLKKEIETLQKFNPV